MKISLRKIVENPNERDPKDESSEARRFLIFLKDNGGYGHSPMALKNVFSDFNTNAANDFIKELIDGGWIKKDFIDRLDDALFITDKTIVLLGD